MRHYYDKVSKPIREVLSNTKALSLFISDWMMSSSKGVKYSLNTEYLVLSMDH